MDLQNFCVESRRKVHSFPFLRSSVQSSDKMSRSFQFGVPVNNTVMEENCLKNIHNIPCDTQFTFQGISKNQDCHPKKSCFDHFNKFSHLTFSRVVGGFVGSKSQGGSANREPHQVWDVIFRHLVDTECLATMDSNSQQYFRFGDAVSQSIFGQLNNSKSSTLGLYFFARPCDFFGNKKMTDEMPGSNKAYANGTSTSAEEAKLSKVPSDIQPQSVHEEKTSKPNKPDLLHSTAKQSYADVAKAFVATRPDLRNSENHQTVQLPSLSKRNVPVNLQQSRRGHEKVNSKRSKWNSSCYSQSSYNHSSQNQQRRKNITMLEKCEDPVPSKFARDKHEHMRHLKHENTHVDKYRKKVNGGLQVAPVKEVKVQDDRKSRNCKFRNRNMREKERKNIDIQVQEETVFACNMPEKDCQNWRCDHNRNSRMCKSRSDVRIPRDGSGSSKYKQQSRLHSPPPQAGSFPCRNRSDFRIPRDGSGSSKYKQQSRLHSPPLQDWKINANDHSLEKRIKSDSVLESMCEETLSNTEKSTSCSSLNLRGNDDSDESLSSDLTSHAVVLPLRARVASECSIESEDSYVIFVNDADNVDEEEDFSIHSSSGSDYSSESELDEDCDEVDYIHFISSEDISTSVSTSLCTDAFSPVPDRLKDIKKRRQKVKKDSKKVHFPCDSELAKVHHMIHWTFAYREARRGNWEEVGRDRSRFIARIEDTEEILSCVLSPEHRRRIWEERMCGLI